MYSNEMRDTHSGKTATIVDKAHDLRRTMRDLRESERGEAFQQKCSIPSFLLFPRFGLPRRTSESSKRDAAFWLVLGTWLFFAAVICAAVMLALHWKPR